MVEMVGVHAPARAATRPSWVAVLSGLALAVLAGAAYRGSISALAGLAEDLFLCGLEVLLLATALVLRRRATVDHSDLAFALFAFVVAGFVADVNVSPIQHAFVTGVLHETPTATDPLASTITGTVLAQLFSTLCMVVPILIVIRAAGGDLKSIYISRGQGWLAPIVGMAIFALFFLLAARGRTAQFFPGSGVSISHFFALAPALVVLVLMNGVREELWFRGLLLQRYAKFFGPWGANIIAAVIFTSFHVQVQYALHLLPFLAYALVLGLVCGYLMQRSGSLIGSAILHAGTDIPIFLAYLAAVSR